MAKINGGATKFPCPSCGDYSARVINSRIDVTLRRRRRECACGHRYNTIELVETTAIEKQKLRRAIEALAEAV